MEEFRCFLSVVVAVEVDMGRKSNSKRRESLLFIELKLEKKVKSCKIKNSNFELTSINSKFFYVGEQWRTISYENVLSTCLFKTG